MNCPYCDFHFGAFAANQKELEDIMPIVCEKCAQVALIEHKKIRKITILELREIQNSPAWEFISAAQTIIYKLRESEGNKPS